MRSSLRFGAIFLALAAPASAQPKPEGAPVAPLARPVRPERPDLPPLTAADCEDPARRAALLADPEATIEAVMGHGRDLTLYSQALSDWRADQLSRSGRWSEEDRQRFGMRILEHPQVQSELAANMRLVGEMVDHAMLLGDARKPEPERCRALLATKDLFDRIAASADAQWRLIDTMFAEEAARIGVALD